MCQGQLTFCLQETGLSRPNNNLKIRVAASVTLTIAVAAALLGAIGSFTTSIPLATLAVTPLFWGIPAFVLVGSAALLLTLAIAIAIGRGLLQVRDEIRVRDIEIQMRRGKQMIPNIPSQGIPPDDLSLGAAEQNAINHIFEMSRLPSTHSNYASQGGVNTLFQFTMQSSPLGFEESKRTLQEALRELSNRPYSERTLAIIAATLQFLETAAPTNGSEPTE